MTIISICIAILYLILILSFCFGFDKVKDFLLSDIKAETKFSIVIPFRNEAENLPRLLKSLSALNYPKQLFEIILVDDNSNDDSVNSINIFIKTSALNISVLKNESITKSPKKDAITTAIQHAQHEWIITTDADCILPQYWLDSFDTFIQHKTPVCIVAPVTYFGGNSFLNRFQTLDMYSLQGATIGGFGIHKPFLCNGANFGYTKSVFNAIEGFKGNTDISSGDDVFLLEKIVQKYSKAVHYVKCEKAIVTTKPQTSWNALIQQRLRWAAKTSAYNSWFAKLVGVSIFLMNLTFLILPILSLSGTFNIKIWVYVLVIKLNVDFLLLYKTSAFFNQRGAFKSFLTSFFVYPFFSVYVAIASLFSGYTWKGRSFKR
ncbi:glycosyltransferase family 2 protein [Hyunsoonleella sp. 2307UL5-6]|uniref:glycosyltransferase family 2 protein n=1 Tax=Hyunsoonleella sp. 2307UL5-6 TaxID=3384768 RepID=UPI0039BC8A38